MENKSTVEGRQEKDKQAFIEALKETPIIAAACKRAGIGRASYYRWRRDDKQFLRCVEDAIAQGFELINDLSEGQIIALIKEKKLPAITLWLKHHHPRYGSLKSKSHIPIAAREDLTPDEQKIVLEALALASGNITHQNNHDNNDTTKIGTNTGESSDPPASGI